MKRTLMLLAVLSTSTASAAGLTMTDTSFLAKAVRGNNFELQAAKLAVNMGRTAAVRTYAAKMIADHTKLGAGVKAAVMQLDPMMKLPTTVTYSQYDMLTVLKRSGRNFDALYRKDMVASHAQTYALFNTYSKSRAASLPLRTTVMNAKPTVKMHWDMALMLPRM
ncbi:DUF4142 domain-containing protein [Deinococcus sp. KSM4-11]|nr:DUF4142 domain-containing protein [Deinococcus sp. KSM4-11]